MLMVALGEILVVVLIRPIRMLLGGQRTSPGRLVYRLENWLLHHLHIIGAESKMRYELEQHGDTAAFLSEGLSDHSGLVNDLGDTLERTRLETGATHADALKLSELHGERDLKRGQRQVDARGGDRTDDIHEAMLQAQRDARRREDRERKHNLRRRRG
jgi:hypothetical protein